MTKQSVLFATLVALFVGFALPACGGDETNPNPPPATDNQTPTTDGGPLPSGQCILNASFITVAIGSNSLGRATMLITSSADAVRDPNPIHRDPQSCYPEGMCVNLWVHHGAKVCGSYQPLSDGHLDITSACGAEMAQAGDTVTLVVKGLYCTEARADFVVK